MQTTLSSAAVLHQKDFWLASFSESLNFIGFFNREQNGMQAKLLKINW